MKTLECQEGQKGGIKGDRRIYPMLGAREGTDPGRKTKLELF